MAGMAPNWEGSGSVGPLSTPSPLPAQPGGRGGILEKHLVREGRVGEGEEGADGPRATVVVGGPGVQDVGCLGKHLGAEPQGPGPIPLSEICSDPRPSSQATCAHVCKIRSVSTVPFPGTDTSAKDSCYTGSRQAWFCSQAWPLPPLSGAQM